MTKDLNPLHLGSKENELSGIIAKISALFEVLPILNNLREKKIVIKCGNNHIADHRLLASIAADVAVLSSLGAKVVLVHGGGPMIAEMVERLGVYDSVIDEYRVTNREVFEVVEMVLSGKINREIVSYINKYGGLAVGLSGRDRNLIVADKLRRVKKDLGSNIERMLDLGMVGEPISVNIDALEEMLDCGETPVIAPIGISKSHQPYSLNADVLAAFIATSIDADRLILLSDHKGVVDAADKLVSNISSLELKMMIGDGEINEQIKQKAESAIQAVNGGVDRAYILNGMVEHPILLDLLSEGGNGTAVYCAHSTINNEVA